MDWDLDGKLDILSGCYANGKRTGALQVLRGRTSTDYFSAETIFDEDGGLIPNIAVDQDKSVGAWFKNFRSQQHAVDYDNDGDLDLVVGSGNDEIHFHENVAGPGEVPKITSNAISLSHPLLYYPEEPSSNPHLVDWDNDGDLDMLCGADSGGAFIAENSGSRSKPHYEPFKVLIPHFQWQSKIYLQRESDPDLQMGFSTRVWATDFNSDGWQDLLIGDEVGLFELAEGVTEIEFKAAFQTLESRNGSTDTSKIDQLILKKRTGFVWVYLRKPESQ